MTDTKMLKEMPKRIPVNGTFELTVRCNLHCKMCLFRHDDSENEEIMQNELSATQWIDMARQAAEAGTGSLLITGGEPMLRPDFCEIWEGIYKIGFITELYTNATLVNDQIMETLRKFPPHKIGVTIYGASPETYEKVCGSASAFQKAIDGMHKLQEPPSKMEFRTSIIKDNFHDINAMEELIHQSFGTQYQLINARMINRAVRGACADVDSCRLTPEDNIRLLFRRGIGYIKEKVGSDFDERYLHLQKRKNESPDNTIVPRLSFFGCDAGMKQYTITWNGELLGCQLLGAFKTNALNNGLLNAWNEYPYVIHISKPNKKCLQCENIEFCGSCAASRYAETGDINGLPEYACQDAAIIQHLMEQGGIKNAERNKL